MKSSLPGLEVQYKHEILASTKHIFFLQNKKISIEKHLFARHPTMPKTKAHAKVKYGKYSRELDI